MISLFDDEQIMKTYWKDMERRKHSDNCPKAGAALYNQGCGAAGAH